MTKRWLLCLALAACADPAAPSESDPEPGTLIRAATGGTVAFGDVTLVVPPGSLSEDTTISIERTTDTPIVDSDGFAVLGAGFRFSPPGTQFSLSKPAVLTMPYDAASLSNQGLDGRTLQLGYYDEELGRYFSIGGELDPVTGLVTARVEHFTLYVAMAATLLPGNNAPTIALQSPIPAVIRANAPVYLRATIRDYDVGGSISGAQLHYRTPATAGFTTTQMHAETALDTFGAMIPAAHVVAGAGVDLEYFVTAVDNLGVERQSTTTNVDLTRSYAPGTLVLAPATPAIAAGFERTFTFQGRDETNALFALVPQAASATNEIGETVISSAGVTFKARTVGAGVVSAGFDTESASLPVTVFNGALDHIAILDKFGVPFDGTAVVDEGRSVQLDAIGLDAYDNQILVNPVWSSPGEVGFVSSSGLLSTLDGLGGGAVTATVGDIAGSQAFFVQRRQFNTSALLGSATTEAPRFATRGTVPYFAYIDGLSIRVAHRAANGSWVADGAPIFAFNPLALAIGASANRVQIAWRDGAQLFSAHLEGDDWVRDGDDLVVDPDTTVDPGYQPHALSIAFAGDTPYLASWETNQAGQGVYVRHWNGSAWILDGAPVVGGGIASSEPSLDILAGVPHVALSAGIGAGGAEVVVYRFVGGAWQQVGDQLGFDPAQPSVLPVLRNIGGRPTVAFQEAVSGRWDLHVRQWDGTTWVVLMHGIINGFDVRDHSLAADGDIPYLVWTERTAGLTGTNRRVAHYNAQLNYWGTVGEWNTSGPANIECAITVANGVPYNATREQFSPFEMRISELR